MKHLIICLLFFTSSCSKDDLIQNQESITANSTKKEDEVLLTKLFKEIETLANAKVCDDSGKWTYTAIGSKACGGPSSYIAYSNDIDTKEFLQKVENYTLQNKEFNKKHGVISDCSLISHPKSVVCENNKPVLKY